MRTRPVTGLLVVEDRCNTNTKDEDTGAHSTEGGYPGCASGGPGLSKTTRNDKAGKKSRARGAMYQEACTSSHGEMQQRIKDKQIPAEGEDKTRGESIAV